MPWGSNAGGSQSRGCPLVHLFHAIRPPGKRSLILSAVLLGALLLAAPALAEYLGPDRVTTEFVTVRDPDNDVWTLTHVDPDDGLADVCLIIHTCEEHPSVERQQALCGWVADNSGCAEAYKTEEQTVVLPEATISEALQNCALSSGWCTSSPTLHLEGTEPLTGESISLIEGTRNGEAFACSGDTCDVPLVEGANDFTFWALSTYGDSSQMGTLSAQVDTVPPVSAFSVPPEGSVVWASGEMSLAGSSSDANSGLSGAEISLDGGASWAGLGPAGDGSWSYRWDTRSVADGTYLVLARAWDIAGHLESTARITVQVDNGSPTVSIPASWFIWEPVSIAVDDAGVGIEIVELTIHGGSYGVRKYSWANASLAPEDFVWDRHFGDIIAPIGEYPVTVTARDGLGNSAEASGVIVVPEPGASAGAAGSTEPAEGSRSTGRAGRHRLWYGRRDRPPGTGRCRRCWRSDQRWCVPGQAAGRDCDDACHGGEGRNIRNHCRQDRQSGRRGWRRVWPLHRGR